MIFAMFLRETKGRIFWWANVERYILSRGPYGEGDVLNSVCFWKVKYSVEMFTRLYDDDMERRFLLNRQSQTVRDDLLKVRLKGRIFNKKYENIKF